MAAMATLKTVPRSDHAPKLIRFPPELAERIEKIARREYRTFTAQVMLMLSQWLEEHPEAEQPKKS